MRGVNVDLATSLLLSPVAIINALVWFVPGYPA